MRLFARAVIETNFDYNWKGAAETLRKALALAPARSDAVIGGGKSRDRSRRNMDRLSNFIRRAVALDPVNAQARAISRGQSVGDRTSGGSARGIRAGD